MAIELGGSQDPSLNELEFGISESSLPDVGDHDVRRFAPSSDGETLLLQPQLADRPIVTCPSTPFTVLGGSTVNVFVTTPLWLEISQAEGKVLADIPTCRLSDTWFGESPRAESFAASARARLDPERLVYHPVRAMTRSRSTMRLVLHFWSNGSRFQHRTSAYSSIDKATSGPRLSTLRDTQISHQGVLRDPLSAYLRCCRNGGAA